ncbi:MAG: polysaccharide biosynthesis tyrosine autokinase [Paracoccaceae bacterium]|nr:polysaccharide biosynthesis tyrosine autokinase [Paracoccaceae bacterium]
MTTSAPYPETTDEDEYDLVQLLSDILAGKYWIAAAVAVALVLGAVSVLKTRPIYRAQAVLQLESRSGSLALPAGMSDMLGGGAGDNGAEAEMEIMKSRMVMAQAVQALDQQAYAYPRPLPFLGLIPAQLQLPDPGFDLLRPYQWGDEAIELGEISVPQDWLGEAMLLTITGPISYRIDLPDGASATGALRARLALPDQGFSLVVDELKGPIGREFYVGRKTMPLAIDDLLDNFSVEEFPRRSSILRMKFSGPDPKRAEAALDAIAQSYVGQNIARSAAEVQSSLTFIEEQLPIAKQKVSQAQDALNAYRQEQQSVDVDFETRTLLEQATEIEAQLSALALQEEDLKKRYTINHPTYQALLQNRLSMEAQLDDVRKSTLSLPETQKEIFNLSRDLQVSQDVYVQLLGREQELRVVRASSVGSARIIDTAFSNGYRTAPLTKRIMTLYLIAGFGVGVGIVLLRRLRRHGIRDAQEIEKVGLPVFATVSHTPGAVNFHKRKGWLSIMAITEPDDMVVEAFRSLRTSLHFGMLDAKTNTILLTSAAPGAGKSFTTVNLAAVAAQAGQKVCIVDADLRKGYLRRYFGVEKGTPGLAEFLAKEKTLDEVLTQGPIEGLSLISSGRYPPNPSELLMRAEFENLLLTLNEQFDLIIVDSPPALAVTDPVVIGRFTGTTIIIARHMETMLGEVEAVRRMFEIAGVKITGAILNGYKASEGGTYGSQYQYSSYRYSYKSDQT